MEQKKNVKQYVEKEKVNHEEQAVKIKYDVYTPEDRDPQPKNYDEIEY